MNRLENKVAIITGAAKGIGLATAQLFAKEGASIVAVSRPSAEPRTDIENLAKDYPVLPLAYDVGIEENWPLIVEQTLERFGKIDILFNNAGISHVPNQNIDDFSQESFDLLFKNNYFSMCYGMHYCVPHMQRGGAVLNMSSINGLHPLGHVGYSASKAMVISTTQHQAYWLAPRGIRVNCIAPGLTATPKNKSKIENPDDPSLKRNKTERRMLAPYGEPTQIAYPALFLCSDEAGYITGQTLLIDGGGLLN